MLPVALALYGVAYGAASATATTDEEWSQIVAAHNAENGRLARGASVYLGVARSVDPVAVFQPVLGEALGAGSMGPALCASGNAIPRNCGDIASAPKVRIQLESYILPNAGGDGIIFYTNIGYGLAAPGQVMEFPPRIKIRSELPNIANFGAPQRARLRANIIEQWRMSARVLAYQILNANAEPKRISEMLGPHGFTLVGHD